MRFTSILVWTAVASAILPASKASAQETVKIAFIDPLSGGAGVTGEIGSKHFLFMADWLNQRQKDYKFEVVTFDNKNNLQDSIIAAQKAIDDGIKIITQANSSAIAGALIDFVQKYNDRNPGNAVIYLNYGAIETALTNEKCSYWHFRFDATNEIKMQALTDYLKGRPDVKNVYLLNPDFSFGKSIRAAARAELAKKRPDVHVVGDDLTPTQKVNDFAPYVAKIKASGADSIITGYFGQDWNLFIKAAADAGLNVNFFTYYAGGPGSPAIIRQSNLQNRVFQISEAAVNEVDDGAADVEIAFRKKEGRSVFYARAFNTMNALLAAMKAAHSTDPMKFAPSLEKTRMKTYAGGEAYMRAEDHQFFQPMFISSFGPMENGMRFDEEGTGWGWHPLGRVDAKATEVPTSCKMKRPS